MKFSKPSLRRSGTWAAVLLGMLVVATACSDAAVDTPGGSSDVGAPLTGEGLKNATYELEELGAIQLSDGEYKHQWGEGATQADLVGLETAALGDLNGDGLDDAAVVLWWQSGGTGTYLYLVAVLNEDGTPRQVGIERLGDRVRVEALSIDAGEMLLTTVTHGPDDPMCCPTQTVRDSYTLQEGTLTKTASDLIGGEAETQIPAELLGTVWHWQELFETMPAAQSVVPNPERYTLLFRSDGSLQIQADCNAVGGSAALEGDRLTLTLGPSTMAFCGEGSLDQPYLELLGKVGGYALESGRLVLHLSEDAGRMTFDVAGATGADDAGSDITGVIWRWEQTTTPVGVIESADAPDKYTIHLLPDGQFQFSADCNTGRGTYTLQGGQLSFEIGPMTRAACPPDSLSDEFIEELNAAAITFVEGGDLYIDLIYDSGTMRFSRGE